MKKDFQISILKACIASSENDWNRYAFRAEWHHDAVLFIGALSSLIADIVIKENVYETCVYFSLNPNVTLKQLRWIANEITDLHVIFETLETEGAFTGDRVYYTMRDDSYYSEPSHSVIREVDRNVQRLSTLLPEFSESTEERCDFWRPLVDGHLKGSLKEKIGTKDRQGNRDRDFYEYHAARFNRDEAWPKYRFSAESLADAEALTIGLGPECYGLTSTTIDKQFESNQAIPDGIANAGPRYIVECHINPTIPLPLLRAITAHIPNCSMIAETIELIEPGIKPKKSKADLSQCLYHLEVRLHGYSRYLTSLSNVMGTAANQLGAAATEEYHLERERQGLPSLRHLY